jgi:hypothetical protein
MDIITWKQLRGNQFNRNLNPEMLVGKGYAVKTVCALAGGTVQPESRAYLGPGERGKFPKQERHVIYDAEYVKEYIHKKILQPLKISSLKELDNVLQNTDLHSRVKGE